MYYIYIQKLKRERLNQMSSLNLTLTVYQVGGLTLGKVISPSDFKTIDFTIHP